MSMRLEWTNQEEDSTDMLDQVYGGFGYKKKHRPPVSVEESIDYFSSAGMWLSLSLILSLSLCLSLTFNFVC